MKKLIVAALIAMTSALAENEQIVFSTPNLAMPFEVHMQRTAVKAAKEMGVKLQVLDGQGSSPNRWLTWKTPSPVGRRALSSPRTT
jgi:inositol transport system substrate-binding protein